MSQLTEQLAQHLRVLRESGLADVRPEGVRRFYSVSTEPLRELDGWLDRFRHYWEPKLDALATEVARGTRDRSKGPDRAHLRHVPRRCDETSSFGVSWGGRGSFRALRDAMKPRQPIALLSLSLLTLSMSGCAGGSGGPGTVRYDNAAKEVHKVVKAETQEKMVKYGSNEELDKYFLALQEAQAKRDAAMYSKSGGDLGGGMMDDASAEAPAAPMEQSAAEPEADSDDASGGESITNTQEQGVGIGPLGQQFARPGLRAGPHSLNYWQSVLHV